jgi:ATP-dependent Clp protease ATP-binding subunit ClpA
MKENNTASSVEKRGISRYPISGALEARLKYLSVFHPTNTLVTPETVLDTIIDMPQDSFFGESLGGVAIETVAKDIGISISNLQDVIDKRIQSQASDSELLIMVGGTTLHCSQSFVDLFLTAKAIAGSQAVDTGHIISADLQRQDSIVLDVFSRNNADASYAKNIIDKFIEIARQDVRKPEPSGGTISIIGISSSEEVIGGKPTPSSFKNLFEEVKKGTLPPVEVKDSWLRDSMAALDSSQVISLQDSSSEEAAILARAIVQQIDQDKTGYYGYKSVLIPEITSLLSDPDGVVQQMVRVNGVKILILPVELATSQARVLRQIIASGESKIIVYGKGNLDNLKQDFGLGIEITKVSPPIWNRTELTKLLMSMKEGITKSIISGSFAPVITDDAFKMVASIAIQYGKTFDMSSVATVFTLIRRAAINLKARLAGLTSADQLVIPDNSIDDVDIARALFHLKGIEVKTDSPERFLSMADTLKLRIIGQDEAIVSLTAVVQRAKSGLKDPNKPIGSFMFIGPSGVGKTELAKALSEFLFGDEKSLIQLNMSEYMEQHAVAKLFGAPPGYVGYEEGGQLTEAVRKKPSSVILLDEIDKANPSVLNALLQVMEEGTLTDGKGNIVDFRNALIIMTCNIGSALFRSEPEKGYKKVKEEVLDLVHSLLRPEFLNRFDDTIVFRSLTIENLDKIVDLQIGKVNRKLVDQGIIIKINQSVRESILRESYDPEMGARPLTRTIKKYIEQPLAINLLKGEIKPGMQLEAIFDELGNIKFVSSSN